MHSFKDKTGHEWKIEIDFSMRDRITEACGIDIAEAKESSEGVAEIFKRPTAVKLALIMTGDARYTTGMTKDEQQQADLGFVKLLNGKAIDELCLAVWAEFEDFFLSTAKHLAAIVANLRGELLAVDAEAAEKIKAMPVGQVHELAMKKIDEGIEAALTVAQSALTS